MEQFFEIVCPKGVKREKKGLGSDSIHVVKRKKTP